MSTLMMLFVATAAFRINEIHGMKVLDIRNIHDNRVELQKKGFLSRHTPEYQSLENENNHEELMGKFQNIIRSPIIEITRYKDNYMIENGKKRDGTNKYGQYQRWPWRQYLYVKPPWLKRVYAPRKLNYHVDDSQKRDSNGNLRNYSKFYLVLDPDTDLSDSDINYINNLISSVLFKSKISKESTVRDHVQKEQLYKGFVLRDNRRRIRESKEMFASTDSVESNHKQKRVRGDYSGGGGRTAIPYIRHRGDIFEKE